MNDEVTIPKLSDSELDFSVSLLGINLWGDYIHDKLAKDKGGCYKVYMSEQQIQAVCELIENYRRAVDLPVNTGE